MALQNIHAVRGKDFYADVAITLNGVAQNITNWGFRLTCKWRPTDTDANALFIVTSDGSSLTTTFNGISITDAVNGKINIHLNPACTGIAAIPAHRIFPFYDLIAYDALNSASANRYPILSGTLVIDPDETNATKSNS